MSEFHCIDPEQALELRQRGATVVDIRDPHSYATLHIAGSQRIDNQTLADFMAQADMDQPLVVVCYHGHSSQSAAAFFSQQGFSEVYSLNGGFEVWRSVYPDETESGSF